MCSVQTKFSCTNFNDYTVRSLSGHCKISPNSFPVALYWCQEYFSYHQCYKNAVNFSAKMLAMKNKQKKSLTTGRCKAHNSLPNTDIATELQVSKKPFPRQNSATTFHQSRHFSQFRDSSVNFANRLSRQEVTRTFIASQNRSTRNPSSLLSWSGIATLHWRPLFSGVQHGIQTRAWWCCRWQAAPVTSLEVSNV